MKGIYKYINDVVKQQSTQTCNDLYVAKFSTKLKKNLMLVSNKDKIIKFDKNYVRENKENINDINSLVNDALLQIRNI